MAAKREEKPKKKYDSPYGSHKNMVNEEKTKALDKPGRVICDDDVGSYETDVSMLDSGMADVNRYKWRGEKQPEPIA